MNSQLHFQTEKEGLQEHRPKNVTAPERKKYATKVFEIIDGEDKRLKNFSGLYFHLHEGKVESVKEYVFNYDNKKLYNMV
jgi:O-glycosyl hydrolase